MRVNASASPDWNAAIVAASTASCAMSEIALLFSVFAVQQPPHTESIGEHAELRSPERVLHGECDLTAFGERGERTGQVSGVGEVERDLNVSGSCFALRRGVTDHQHGLSDPQRSMDHAVSLVRRNLGACDIGSASDVELDRTTYALV